MPVTQNYKTVTFSADALMYVKAAVKGQMAGDRRQIEITQDSAMIEFLRGEVVAGTEVLISLDSSK